jgi:hypothetical protein
MEAVLPTENGATMVASLFERMVLQRQDEPDATSYTFFLDACTVLVAKQTPGAKEAATTVLNECVYPGNFAIEKGLYEGRINAAEAKVTAASAAAAAADDGGDAGGDGLDDGGDAGGDGPSTK